ncbi:helix-turn-helix domain-containing protein [Massilia sp. IC2-476]|uniref:AraC family transcriptional regulator n=1 Tax=Massilia sp. IC2-476 TaxID=2887199 RepID=UPI001D10BCA6|nr:helix-turn-helix domain-containing protein [Massilia sp. IC2-476]MCC2974154.1 helix-turn-helix domain-containing protein [Massilia sp. IC2-476]
MPAQPSAPNERQLALPRRALAPWVKNLIGGGFEVVQPHLPASPDAQLVIYLRGGATLLDGQGAGRLPPAFLSGPSLAPRRFVVEPGSAFMSAVFRASGILYCFGIPADCLGAASVPLDAVIGQGNAERLQDELQHARGFRERVRVLEDFLLRQAGDGQGASLPQLSFERLFQPVGTLAADLGLGVRQFERRFLAHHGVALRDYRRLARFAMALSRLMREDKRPTLAQAALDAGYVDQAHFSRDFRQFVGDTPSGFLARRGDSDSGYRFWQFGREELDSFTR